MANTTHNNGSGNNSPKKPPDTEPIREAKRALRYMCLTMLAGILAQALFSLQFTPSKALAVLAAGAIWSGLSLSAGALLGFVFAIPRSLQEAGAQETATNNGPAYGANTNLEQISDWLTKIIVGVGLVELGEAPRLLRQLGAFAGPEFGGNEAFPLFVLVFYSVLGSMFGYLWTRLFLPGALASADRSGLYQLEKRVKEMATQADVDADAISLVERQLEPNADEPAITQEQLNVAVRQASASTRASIYRRAQRVRRSNWKDADKKEIMERSIPVFRALIEADDRYHRDHAQLGYALKDQRQPNLPEAKQFLSKAIEIRDSLKQSGYKLYEFNRALVNIAFDVSANPTGPTDRKLRDEILRDLRSAQTQHSKLIAADADINAWLERNELDENALATRQGTSVGN